MAMADSFGMRALLAVLLSASLAVAVRETMRYSNDANEELRGPLACSSRTSCTACLLHKPFVTGGTFCKWCPQQFWVGPAQALSTNATGVCQAEESSDQVCANGLKWFFAADGLQQAEHGRQATTLDEAKEFCPALEDESYRVQPKLSDLQGKDLQDPKVLETTLFLLNLDLQRLMRLNRTNPTLFEMNFGSFWATARRNIGLYAWKTTVWGTGFIPVFGGAISLGLGVATSMSEASVEEVSTALASQRSSQSNLCSKGKNAKLEYFIDVTNGMLLDQYKALHDLSAEQLIEKRNNTLKTGLVDGAGTAVTKVADSYTGNAGKATKAVLHAGLFAAGFFTFGVTWIVGSALGGTEVLADISLAYGKATSLSQKMFLLTSLAQQMDKIVWDSDLEPCFITDNDLGHDPCPDVKRGEEPDAPNVPRVCSRSSPWGHHLEKIPNAELSPEGRCVPRTRPGFENGLPCVTHEGCQSGYCHFEPRLQYFFSDHARQKVDTAKKSIFDELLAFQVAEVPIENQGSGGNLWSSRPGNFTSTYRGSYQGAVYATTGTCSTACPEEAIGQGSCAELSIGGAKYDKRIPFLGRFQFGVRQQNRIFVGDGVGFARIGDGPCATFAGPEIHPLKQLVKRKAQSETNGENVDTLVRCAKICKDEELFLCQAFAVRFSSEECVLYGEPASTVQQVQGADGSEQPYDEHDDKDDEYSLDQEIGSCHSATPGWPLDIYQPWNVEWSMYLLNLASIADALADESKAELQERALQAVRRAYPKWCQTSFHCILPEEWQADDAIRMLRFEAPLSVEQLRQVREELEPGSTENLAPPRSTILPKEMFLRPNGFGAAWRFHLSTTGADEALSWDKGRVQNLEARAIQYSLRTSAGLWDLSAATMQMDQP